MTVGFYTTDLAMADIKVDDLLRVVDKEYDPKRDMMYWEFNRVVEAIDD